MKRFPVIMTVVFLCSVVLALILKATLSQTEIEMYFTILILIIVFNSFLILAEVIK